MTAGIKFHHVSSLLGGGNFKLPHVEGPQVQEALQELSFTVPYQLRSSINQTEDIPYLCGYDTQSDIVYFDRDFDPSSYHEAIADYALKWIDENFPEHIDCPACLSLASHEEIEKDLESVENWNYEQRHHVATYCEKQLVEWLGWDWKEYSVWTTQAWHSSYSKWRGSTHGLVVPATLDMSPYTNEGDSIVKKMREAGAKDKGEEP